MDFQMLGPFPLGQLMQKSEEPDEHPIDPLGQAMELRERWDRVWGKEPDPRLVPGVLVMEQERVGIFNLTLVLVIIRMLDVGDPQDLMIMRAAHTNLSHDRLDVLVGYICEDGSHLVVKPHTLRRLRLYDQATDGKYTAPSKMDA